MQNYPRVLKLYTVHNEVFTAGALEAVRRTSDLRERAGKTS